MQDVAYKKTDIEETMRSAYLSYAMSVITARATRCARWPRRATSHFLCDG